MRDVNDRESVQLAVPYAWPNATGRECNRPAFEAVIGCASDHPITEPWIDSLCLAAGGKRVLLADERGCYDVRDRAPRVRLEDVSFEDCDAWARTAGEWPSAAALGIGGEVES